MGANGAEDKKGLVEFQNKIVGAANSINYSTKTLRQKAEKKKPKEVTKREKASQGQICCQVHYAREQNANKAGTRKVETDILRKKGGLLQVRWTWYLRQVPWWSRESTDKRIPSCVR